MGQRRIRREQVDFDQKKSRMRNGILKADERIRRDERMIKIIKNGKLPYLPSVMSWLSSKCDKPSRLITQAEVDALAK
jgi:hypothetical protein